MENCIGMSHFDKDRQLQDKDENRAAISDTDMLHKFSKQQCICLFQLPDRK
jgi:hypothetical protein